MRNIKLAKILMVLNGLFFFTYNTIFGWNNNPINHNEELCDDILMFVVYLSWIIYFLPVLTVVYENWIREHEKKNPKID